MLKIFKLSTFERLVSKTLKRPKRLKIPFQKGHELLYGLIVSECNDRTCVITAVTCRLCTKFGREAKPRMKRKRTANAQMFKSPFRADTYKCHHENCHPVKWIEYDQASNE